VTISVESRACHFRSGQLDLQLVPDQFAKCLCTLKLALVKFTHFRRELECKSGHLGSQGTILAVVYKLPKMGCRRVIGVEVAVRGRLQNMRVVESF